MHTDCVLYPLKGSNQRLCCMKHTSTALQLHCDAYHAVLFCNSHALLFCNSHALLFCNSHALLFCNSHALLFCNSYALLLPSL